MMLKPAAKALLRSRLVGKPLLKLSSAVRWRRACRWLARFSSYRPERVALNLNELIQGGARGWMYTAAGSDQVAVHVWQHGLASYEAPLPRLFAQLAARSRRVLIVGASTGAYALIASLADPSVRVDAFEPYPTAHAWLERNVAANGLEHRVRLFRQAVGDRPGWARLFVPPQRADGILETSASLNRAFCQAHQDPLAVQAVTLDEHCAGTAPVDLILMDIETHEPAALLGARRTLAAHRPIIVLEVLAQANLELLNTLRQEIGYAYAELTPEGLLSRSHIRYRADHRNHLLFPPEKFATVQSACATMGLAVAAA